MSSNSRRRTAVQSHAASRRRPRFMLAGVVVAALALVGTLVAAQAVGTSSSDKLPPRVATGEGRVLGDADAPVTIVEYADFQCPVCKRAAGTILSRIEEAYVREGLVKVEFRMFPFLGPESWNAAQAAEAARDQGKFWEYHDALFNAQGRENSGAFSYERLVELAGDIGLNVATFEETLGSNRHLDALEQEAQAAQDAGVTSTPTFFINGKKIVGAQDYGVFQRAIEDALAKGEASS